MLNLLVSCIGTLRARMRLTDGERRLGLAVAVIAACGVATAIAIALRIGNGAGIRGPYELWFLVCGASGAALTFLFYRSRFGHDGLRGLGDAAVGAAMTIIVGSIAAGTLALPVIGTMFAPWLLLVTLVQSPLLALLWATTFGAVHLLARDWQAERDSVFVALPR